MMIPALDEQVVAVHRDEIISLVKESDPTRAVKRLMDFARDIADRNLKNETVAISAKLSRVRKQQREGTATPNEIDAMLNRIVKNILDLSDQIYDHFEGMERQTEPAKTLPVNLTLVTSEQGPDPTENQRVAPEPPVSIEEARRRFRGGGTTSEHGRRPKPVFSCRDLKKQYRRGARAFSLSDVSLDLIPGEITGLVGVNGSGKTTLLRMIAGELKPSGGELTYPLLDDGSLQWGTISQQIAYVEQLPAKWYGRLRTNLQLAAAFKGIKGNENEEDTEFYLQRLGLEEYGDARWNEISGGYKMRFELARALLTHPRLLILDEPLAPLDVITQQLFLRDLRDLANSLRNPIPIIVSSQHLYEIESIADQMLFLDIGRPAYYGRTEEIGKGRTVNMFEVSIASSSDLLSEVLEGVKGLYIEQFGLRYIIQTSKSVDSDEVLTRLIKLDAQVKYFRELSHSSRMLFHQMGENN
jgi:ABC-2 type transport system ATP-binding protein